MAAGSFIQKLIHGLEVGAGPRYIRLIALAVAVIALAVFYDVRVAHDFSAPEAMDSAQLARNISDGKGFTTSFVRPFSLYLVQKHNQEKSGVSLSDTNFDLAQIKIAHPDLANPPVYPLMLASLMKIFPFNFAVETKKPFWSDGGYFQRYQPEFFIAIFNEILLLIVVLLTFLLARNLFDSNIAWLSAMLVLGCEQFWRFSAAGLSTIFLLVIFLTMTSCLLRIERNARETESPSNLLSLSILVGAIVGIGALTRYSFGWVIIPVVVFLILFGGQKRLIHVIAAFGMFIIFLLPWIIRNEVVSGTAFGTAGFALMEGTYMFPKFQLERSIHPDISHAFSLKPYLYKFVGGLREILSNDLPKLGGSWASILFLAGLLLNFRSIGARRVRYFLLMCLGTFIFIQALGRTQLSEESPEINSENLLILVAPIVFIFGASFFFTLLQQRVFQRSRLRYVVIAVFVAICSLPMIFSLLPPKSSPLNYPPYYPPEIQASSGWMKENELMMSDIPWAVAWYGHRQCVWLTLDAQDDFMTIYKGMKPVQALYLTPKTMDAKFLSEWALAGERSWGNFIFKAITENQIPKDFPLRRAPAGFLPEKIFLSDDDNRWKKPE